MLLPQTRRVGFVVLCLCWVTFAINAQHLEVGSISGTLLMLDNKTPHMSVLVQAVRNGKVAASTLSGEDGEYRFINLKPGAYQVRCQIKGEYIYYSTSRAEGESAPSARGSGEPGERLQVKPNQPLENIDFHVAGFKKGTWRTYTSFDGLAHYKVYSIHETSDGMLWVGTDDGVSRYDGVEFVNFTTDDGLVNNRVRSIHETSDGMLWFATARGVSRYDRRKSRRDDCKTKAFINFTTNDGLAHDYVWSIHETEDGMLWFGTRYSGVSRYDGVEFVNFATNDGLAGSWVYSIHETRDGMLWFATDGGVSRYDGVEFVNFTVNDGLAGNTVLSIHETADGMLWFGTNDGVSRYDGVAFVNFATNDGLASNYVRSIHETRDGMLWFATDDGVSRYDGVEFVNFTTNDGLADRYVWSIHETRDGMLWFATSSGLSSYEPKTFTIFTTNDGLAHNGVSSIHGTSNGMLWFGTFDGGVSRYDGVTFVNFTTKDGLVDNQVRSIHEASDGMLWFGTFGGGVSRYDGVTFVNFTPNHGLPDNEVRDIHETADGMLWFGTWSGVSRYDGVAFVNFTTLDGLANNVVRSIHETADGMLWFGTNGGVSRYDGVKFVNFTTNDGLVDNRVLSIHETADDILWFATRGGVSRYDGITFQSLDSRDFGKQEMAWNWISKIHQSAKGVFWFATNVGLVRYAPSQRKPKVEIVAVKGDKDYTQRDAISLTTGNRLTIVYRALDFKTLPQKRVYRYRIKEGDAAWGPFTNTTATSFEQRFDKQGQYTFEVQYVDRDFNVSDPARVVLHVVPPWYLNGWIAIPSGGGILALLISAIFFGTRSIRHRREAQRLQAEMLEQELKAREALEAKNTQLEEAKDAAEAANRAKSAFLANMSHEIRTPMNAVLGYAQILQRADDFPPHHRIAIQTIENSGNHLLALINDVLDLSKIEAGRLELTETEFDLKGLIDGISAMFAIRCEQKGLAWQVEGLNEERIFVLGDVGKLRQVLINLLGNAVKFTDSGWVTLKVAALPSPTRRGAGGEVETGDSYRFSVIDTGIGIASADQASIFDAFQQSEAGMKAGGTGLGLALSLRYVQLMGGELQLESELGKGSRFFFTIPLSSATADAVVESSQWSAVTRLAEGHTVKALICDDVKVNRDVLKNLLESIGVSVLEAENGQQGIEMTREHLPDIVFMDIRMPVLDGLEARAQIFAEFGKDRFKLVAISASTLEHEQQSYFDSGFDDFISKPFRFERVCECLATLLGVEFERGEPEHAEAPTTEVPDVALPAELLTQMKARAELYEVTKLREHINEVEALGPEGRRLAERLRGLIQNYDMEAVLKILSEIESK